MPVSIPSSNAEWLRASVDVIERGGVVALPFERLFGLAADALDSEAVEKSAGAKGRDSSMPISVIIPNMNHLERITSGIPHTARKLIDRFWPGPLTLLLPAGDDLPKRLVSSRNLIGVRLPSPCPALELALATDRILTATSANRTGESDPLNHEQLGRLDGVDLVIPGYVQGPPGSTIVDPTGDFPTVLRPGVLNVTEALKGGME